MQLLAGHPTVDDPDRFLDELRAVAGDCGLAVQTFDAGYVAGRPHMERAVDLARRERERGKGIADSLAVEVLCYAAGRRQISEALTMGVDDSTDGVVVVLLEDSAEAERPPDDDRPSLERASEALRERFELADPEHDATARATLESIDESTLDPFFDVTATEREAALAEVPELVAERVALLVVER
jgi:KEOPS complex subunit Cgi121